MDALSDVLRVIRLSGGVFLEAELTAPWCVGGKIGAEDCKPFLEAPRQVIPYHFVAVGSMQLRADGSDAIEVRAGEIVLLPHSSAHSMGSELTPKPVPVREVIQVPKEGRSVEPSSGSSVSRPVAGARPTGDAHLPKGARVRERRISPRWSKVGLLACILGAVASGASAEDFKAVPELGYRVNPNFFHGAGGLSVGEASGIALNSKGHVFLFQRARPMLSEYDATGQFVRSVGEGLFTHPHGLRIDPDDNIWTTDDGSHLVLKLSRAGQVLLVLGRKDVAGEADWLFNQPTDVAFGKDGEIYVSDGYGNSRVMKFDRAGKFIKSWGHYGSGPGEFSLPHSLVVDQSGRVYVADRENMRIQIFDAAGNYLKEWTHIGYPYGLFITPDQHIWMVDGGYDRILELDQNGKILGAFGEPGHAPGQLAWGHFLALGPDRTLYVADVLNWRFQVFRPIPPTGKFSTYIPSKRMFWDREPSSGWSTHTSVPKN